MEPPRVPPSAGLLPGSPRSPSGDSPGGRFCRENPAPAGWACRKGEESKKSPNLPQLGEARASQASSEERSSLPLPGSAGAALAVEGWDRASPSPTATHNFAAANACQEQPPPGPAAPTGRKARSTAPHGAPPSFHSQGEGAAVSPGLCPRWPGRSTSPRPLHPMPVAGEGCCWTALIKARWGFLLCKRENEQCHHVHNHTNPPKPTLVPPKPTLVPSKPTLVPSKPAPISLCSSLSHLN